jgi:hypothetical protein
LLKQNCWKFSFNIQRVKENHLNLMLACENRLGLQVSLVIC